MVRVVIPVSNPTNSIHTGNAAASEPAPGLQTKVARGEPLPLGWQGRLDMNRGDYLPDDLYRYGRICDVDDRRQRVEIEDRVYYILRGTRKIIDILHH